MSWAAEIIDELQRDTRAMATLTALLDLIHELRCQVADLERERDDLECRVGELEWENQRLRDDLYDAHDGNHP